MKIKDLIKHLQTLDQEKELVILATDPTNWEYGHVVTDKSIKLETIVPCEDNGLEDEIEMPRPTGEEEVFEADCYVIRINV